MADIDLNSTFAISIIMLRVARGNREDGKYGIGFYICRLRSLLSAMETVEFSRFAGYNFLRTRNEKIAINHLET